MATKKPRVRTKAYEFRQDQVRSSFKGGERVKLRLAACSDEDGDAGAGGTNRLRFNLGDGGNWLPRRWVVGGRD